MDSAVIYIHPWRQTGSFGRLSDRGKCVFGAKAHYRDVRLSNRTECSRMKSCCLQDQLLLRTNGMRYVGAGHLNLAVWRTGDILPREIASCIILVLMKFI